MAETTQSASRRRRARAMVVGLSAAMALAACSDDGPAAAPPGSTTGVTGTVTVFAASSLTDVFEEIGGAFEAANPGSAVELNFAASSALATQINEGAPADVFAAASPSTMATVTDAGGAAGEPVVFVRNQLVIVVAEGNPLGIDSLADLANPDVLVALCAEEVPCGAAAHTALDESGVTVTAATEEENVRAALNRVVLGEVDAALVYRTDAATEPGAVDAIDFPESATAITNYPIVALREAPNQAGATAFVAFVLSPAGMAVLTGAGFQAS